MLYRCIPGVGQVSLQQLAAQMLLQQASSENSQNQNAGFCGWIVLTIALQNSLQSSRALLKGSAG